MKGKLRLDSEKLLPDGSYLSRVYPPERDRRHQTNGAVLRVIDYRLEGIEGAEPLNRLATTILDRRQTRDEQLPATPAARQAPAQDRYPQSHRDNQVNSIKASP